MTQRTALLAGATGLIGKHCLQLLLNDPVYSKVIVLTRRKLDIQHERLEQHVLDFETLAQHAALMKADDVFCTLGTTRKKSGGSQAAYEKIDYHYPVQIATLAQRNGATQFLIVTSLGTRHDSSVFYLRLKA
ncbi:MAG: NAD(P)H-binding protein [Bacteroidota bacterium]